MGDKRRRAIKVTAHEGWTIIDDAPVKFVRTRSMLPLPEPEAGGSIDLLRPFLNTASEDDFLLIVGWMIAAFRSQPPAAILAIIGEQGSAKSTATRLTTSLIDPRIGGVRGMIGNSRDLAIAAKGTWVLSFDNVSSIAPDQSDHMCRLSTGDAFTTRKLHSDDDELVFEACRPIVLNGIGDPITRSDLADRTLLVSLASIPKDKRRSEKHLMAELVEKKPYILGALLDGLSSALRHQADINLDGLERLADMQQFVMAAEPGLGWEPGTFNAAFVRAQHNKRLDNIANNPVARIVCQMMETRQEIMGTPTELLTLFTDAADERAHSARDWPKDAQAIGFTLSRIAKDMRTIGIDIENSRSRDRIWIITKLKA